MPILKGALGLSGADAQRAMALRNAAHSNSHKERVQFLGQCVSQDVGRQEHATLDPVSQAIVASEIDRCTGATLNVAREVLVELGQCNDAFLKDQLIRLDSILKEGGEIGVEY